MSVDQDQQPHFLDTHIAELNDLLTRNTRKGIAWPGTGYCPSSITVFRGNAGAGKSVLCSLLAQRFHLQAFEPPVKKKAGKTSGPRRFVIPFSIYFSFSHSADGLFHYIKDIFWGNLKNAGKQPLAPILIAPRSSNRMSSGSGVEVLRRGLLEELTPFTHPAHTAQNSREDRWAEFQRFIGHIRESDQWDLGNPMDQLREYDGSECLPTRIKGHEITPEDEVRIEPIVFVDPLNFLFALEDSRAAIAELMDVFRVMRWPLIATVEAGGELTQSRHRQLISFVEFEADTVLEMSSSSGRYFSRTIQVQKNRNSQHILGHQSFRIERPGHTFWNIPWSWNAHSQNEIHAEGKQHQLLSEHGHPGFMLFLSIHWFLSRVRRRQLGPSERYSSGIQEINKLLTDSPESHHALPPDSFVLIRGKKGGHKFTIGFNVLFAALGKPRPSQEQNPDKSGPLFESKTAMLLSMGEEIHNGIPRVALTGENLENFDEAFKFGETPVDLNPEGLEDQLGAHLNSKVDVRLWHRRTSPPLSLEDLIPPQEPKIVEVKFKPGLLSPEEFLWVVSSLTKFFAPSRLMLENTAHLKTRFPQLSEERMLFQALGSLALDHNMILIVTDITDDGSDRQLSLGLAASADFIFNIDPLKKKELRAAPNLSKRSDLSWSKLTVSNIRGKNYRGNAYAITVEESREDTSEPYQHELEFHDIKDALAGNVSGKK